MDEVLIIDDEWSIREISTLMLEKSGYKVLSASDAAEGLKLLTENSPVAVIIDVVLPGKNGLEFALEISQIKPGIPIVLMSGRISTEADSIRNFTGHFGIACALAKPFTHAQLLAALENAVKSRC